MEPWLKTPVVTRNDLFLTNEFLEFYFHLSKHSLLSISQPCFTFETLLEILRWSASAGRGFLARGDRDNENLKQKLAKN